MKLRLREISGFPIVPLEEVAEILDYRRKPVSSTLRAAMKGDIPYYGANGLLDHVNQHLFEEELVLVAEDGGFFDDPHKPIAYRVGGKSWVNNHAHVLRPRPAIDIDWLNFAIAHQEVSEFINGAVLPKLTQRDLRRLPIPLPKPAEQRRVVARIKECLSRVEEMQRLREEVASEVGSVEERLLGEVEESLRGCCVPLGQVLEETQNGKSLQNKETGHNGRALTLSAVKTHRLDLAASKPAQINSGRDEKYLVHPCDVFISRSNTRELVARSAIAPERIEDPTIFSDLLIRLSPKPKALRGLYLVIALRMPGVRRQLQANAIGSSQTMVKISGERLRTVEIPVPTPTEQEAVESKFSSISSLVGGIASECDDQERDFIFVRESILREAFAGNL